MADEENGQPDSNLNPESDSLTQPVEQPENQPDNTDTGNTGNKFLDQSEVQLNFGDELKRKLIHLSILIIPVLYSVSSSAEILFLLIPITLIFVTLDLMRHYNDQVRRFAISIFGGLIRKSEESKQLSSASFLLIAACICILVFPKLIAITALSVVIISDAAAALIGRKFGMRKFINKTIEGTLAFITFGMIVIYVIAIIAEQNLMFILSGLVSVCIAAVIEASSGYLRIDDNFTIPIVIGFFMGLLL